MSGVFMRIVACAGLMLSAACAPMASTWPAGSARSDAAEDASVVMIEVWHNAAVANALTIYLVGTDGVTRRLGRVSPSATESFEVRRSGLGSDFRLVAQSAIGQGVRSPFFSLNVSYGVTWDVDRNRIGPLWAPDAEDPEPEGAGAVSLSSTGG